MHRTLHETLPAAPARCDVRAALLWALEHDRLALLEHRESTQSCSWESARSDADHRLVRRWRVAVAMLPPAVA